MFSNQCEICAWLQAGEGTCYAYGPGPIPEEIATGEVTHTKERGDEVRKGVVFKSLLPDAEE